MQHNEDEPEMPQPCDEWRKLITDAEYAGGRAARQLALHSSAWHLGRSGSIDIHVEPLESPVASWLHSTGQATRAPSHSGMLVPITLTAPELGPAWDATGKARSLLIAHAYAAAYCSLLAEEAGVTTEIRIRPDSMSPRGSASDE